MDTVKIIENGRNQTISLPSRYRFSDGEVYIRKLGDIVMLVPKDTAWNTFLEGLNGFTDDFFADGREQGVIQEREEL